MNAPAISKMVQVPPGWNIKHTRGLWIAIHPDYALRVTGLTLQNLLTTIAELMANLDAARKEDPQ